MPKNCVLCDDNLEPLIGESIHWIHILNYNQDFLGKSMIVLRRHLESVTDLANDEWIDLQEQLKIATNALQAAFAPVHFNYAFLQNQDKHVHIHVIPRYSGTQVFEGHTFPESDFPRPGDPNNVSQDLLAKIADALKKHF